MIPDTVHFVFFNQPASERPFALYHFLAVESALQLLQPDRVRLRLLVSSLHPKGGHGIVADELAPDIEGVGQAARLGLSSVGERQAKI
jgi:hypothetical protein